MAGSLRPVASLNTPAQRALAALLLALVVWAALLAALPRVWQVAEELTGDWVWRLTASDTPERRVILVDIDEASLRSLGDWPWPRERLAQLSDSLAAAGASLQIFDVVFPFAADGDAQLHVSLKKNNALLAQVFSLDDTTRAASGHPSAALKWAACPPNLPVATGFVANASSFADLPAGHITPLVEFDGVVRRQPALICSDGKVYPALFIAALAQVLDSPEIRLEAAHGLFAPAWQLVGATLGNEGLPLDAHGNVRIPWRSQPEGLTSVSASDVLSGKLPTGLLENAWVIVGSTALGLNDRIATPFGGSGSGLSVHAELLRGVLDAHIPATPRFAQLYQTLVTLALALGLLALSRQSRRMLLLLAASTFAGIFLLCLIKAVLLVRYALWFDWVPAGLYLLLLGGGLAVITHARNRFERDRLYTHLSSYLPRSVAAALVRQDPSGAIDATRRTITVLFADIRNFSAYCEARPPEESTAVLHTFFSTVTRIVESYGGVVESFQGDAVLAVWGSNRVSPEPEQALAAAHEILKDCGEILPKPQDDGLSPLALGIGLETGIAIVGSFGLARRRTHLAIGHTVTTAARLQEMTIELAHPILVGEGMAASLANHTLESQGIFLLDGLKVPCHIYACPLRTCVEAC